MEQEPIITFYTTRMRWLAHNSDKDRVFLYKCKVNLEKAIGEINGKKKDNSKELL